MIEEDLGLKISPLLERLFFVLIGLAIIIYFLLLNNNLSPLVDNVRHLVTAKSLLSGQGYSRINLPHSPFNTHYPPGYPLILAGTIYFFSFNMIPLKLISILATILSLYLIFLLMRRTLSFSAALIVASLFSVSPLLVKFSALELPEAIYLVFSVLTLLLVERPQEQTSSWGYLFLALLTGLFAYYIKSIGIAFLLAIPLFYFLKKRPLQAVVFGAAFLTLALPWILIVSLSKSAVTANYYQQFIQKDLADLSLGTITIFDLFKRVVKNAFLYSSLGLADIRLGGYLPQGKILKAGMYVLANSLSLVGLTGFITTLRRRISAAHLYVLFLFGIYLLWPTVNIRYIYPIFPFILLYLLSGVKFLATKLSHLFPSVNLARGSVILLTATLFLFSLPTDGYIVLSNIKRAGLSSGWANFYQASKWLKKHSSKDSVVVSIRPETTYLLSDRKTVSYRDSTYFPRNKDFYQSLLNQDFDYVLLDSFVYSRISREPLAQALKNNEPSFRLVYKTPKPVTFIYEVVKN